MYDICCVGHLTLDRIITPGTETHMAGGTSFYFSCAIRQMDLSYVLVTALAAAEMQFVTMLREQGITVKAFPSRHTVYFENIYGPGLDQRTQRVLQEADPFTVSQLEGIDARIFHLGPLLSGDIPPELVRYLAGKGKVAIDVQGYLRSVSRQQVCPVSWPEKKEVLQYAAIVKADEAELEVLTGCPSLYDGAAMLADWGVAEVVITRAGRGSVIYAGGKFYEIPAFPPKAEVDATGCGDTYMAGYLSRRAKNCDIMQSGVFGAAMASLKMEFSGPFTGTEKEILQVLQQHGYQ